MLGYNAVDPARAVTRRGRDRHDWSVPTWRSVPAQSKAANGQTRSHAVGARCTTNVGAGPVTHCFADAAALHRGRASRAPSMAATSITMRTVGAVRIINGGAVPVIHWWVSASPNRDALSKAATSGVLVMACARRITRSRATAAISPGRNARSMAVSAGSTATAYAKCIGSGSGAMVRLDHRIWSAMPPSSIRSVPSE